MHAIIYTVVLHSFLYTNSTYIPFSIVKTAETNNQLSLYINHIPVNIINNNIAIQQKYRIASGTCMHNDKAMSNNV